MKFLKKAMKALVDKVYALFDLSDVVFLLAVALLAYGVWLIHRPLAFIVVGAIFVVLTTWKRFK